MFQGIVVFSEVPIVESLIEQFVATRPHPLSILAAEMVTPLLLRLGVPVDRLGEYLANDTALPVGTTHDSNRLTTSRLVQKTHNMLASLCTKDCTLLRATIDKGEPRVFEAFDYDFPSYRQLGFATVSARIEGSGPSYTVRFTSLLHKFSTVQYVHRDAVVSTIVDIIVGHSILKLR